MARRIAGRPEPGSNLTGRGVYADFVKTGPRAEHATIPVFVLK